jgi:hypothetical protein
MILKGMGSAMSLNSCWGRPQMLYSVYVKIHHMAEVYLDPNIIIIAVVIIVAMIGFFDFLPYHKETPVTEPESPN